MVCREFFGWDDTESLMLIAETASASSAPVRALDDLVHAALDRPGVRDVMSRPDVTLNQIRAIDAGYRIYYDAPGFRPNGVHGRLQYRAAPTGAREA
jgi:hypothetical protein